MVDRKGTDADLLDLVGEIYDCAVDPTRWPAVLERATRLLDGRNAVITLNNVARPQFTLRAQWNVDPEFEAAMAANYAANPLLPEVWYSGRRRADIATVEARRGRSEEDRLVWRDHGRLRLPRRDHQPPGEVVRPVWLHLDSTRNDKPPFDDADLDLMRRLGTACAACCAHRRSPRYARYRARRSLRDLEKLTIGVLLTDQAGRIAHANSAATRMLEEGSAACRDRDTITARDSSSARELAQAMRAPRAARPWTFRAAASSFCSRAAVGTIWRCGCCLSTAGCGAILERRLRHALRFSARNRRRIAIAGGALRPPLRYHAGGVPRPVADRPGHDAARSSQCAGRIADDGEDAHCPAVRQDRDATAGRTRSLGDDGLGAGFHVARAVSPRELPNRCAAKSLHVRSFAFRQPCNG